MTRARVEMPLLTDLQTMLPHLVSTIDKIRLNEPRTRFRSGIGKRLYAVGNHFERSKAIDSRARHQWIQGKRLEHRGTSSIAVIAAPKSVFGPASLDIDPALTADWLVSFLREESRLRGFAKGVIGISGGVDSAVTAFLAARALGPSNVLGIRLPYETSSPDSLSHAQLVIDRLGIESRTIDISAAVDGYLANEPDADGAGAVT